MELMEHSFRPVMAHFNPWIADSECEVAVTEDPGAGSYPRWTYDPSQKLCKNIRLKESVTGSNIFQTIADCQRRCIQENAEVYPRADDACDLPQETGPCMALILMWYYDKTRQACDTFFYGGCQGNGNRFDNKDNCTKLCVIPKKGKSGGSSLSEEPSDSQNDAGLIIGIVFGCVFGAAFLITLGMYLAQRKKVKKQQHKLVPATEMK
ncbi:inter-alpha-trypsin inhibitor-like [Pseudophryne corroboree]|uniref:inter-alpha-trypsin inhibitor-like n=1 Tax=Pseudophryne corroboree TaxID=495146 RepID=UPI0030813FA8